MKYIKLDPKEVRNISVIGETDIKGIFVKRKRGKTVRQLFGKSYKLPDIFEFKYVDEKGRVVELEGDEINRNIFTLSRVVRTGRVFGIEWNKYTYKTTIAVDTENQKAIPVASIEIPYVDKSSERLYFVKDSVSEMELFNKNISKISEELLKDKKVTWIEYV